MRSNAACANDASGWLSAKSAWSSAASRSVRAYASGSASSSSTPEVTSSSRSDSACSARRRRPRSSSWLSSISARIAATVSAGCWMTLRIMAWSTRIRDTSGSGVASRSRANVSSVQLTTPSAGFLRWIRRSFFGSSPAFATARALSIACSGACTTT